MSGVCGGLCCKTLVSSFELTACRQLYLYCRLAIGLQCAEVEHARHAHGDRSMDQLDACSCRHLPQTILAPSSHQAGNSKILKEQMELLLENHNHLMASKAEIRNFIRLNFEREVFWELLLKEYKALEKNV